MGTETNAPSYLNKDFFKKALECGLQTNGIEIDSFEITMGSEAGDNYSSNIYRASVAYTQNESILETLSLIVKSVPYDDSRRIVFEIDAPEKEMYFYQHLVSKLEALLPDIRIAPKCYYLTRDPLYTIVFEDLKTEGFTLGKRQCGLNESECKVVLELLGKYHGTSMYLLEQEPHLFKNPIFKHGIFTPVTVNNPLMESVFMDSLLIEIDAVGSWPGYEKYAQKLKSIHSNIKDRLLEVVSPVENELKVLIHGDLWVNNFMLKYSSKEEVEATDVRFLDFQAFFVSSPGIDLNYFLNTSVQHDVLVTKRDFLVENYYQSLVATLKTLKYQKIPTLDTIKTEIRRKEFYGFISGAAIIPVLSLDDRNSADCSLELFSDKDAAERKWQIACKTPRFEQTMKYMLKRADELGVLD